MWEGDLEGYCHVCHTPVYIDSGVRIRNEKWIFPRYYCEDCYKKSAKISDLYGATEGE